MNTLLTRDKVKSQDQWDLKSLFASEELWQESLNLLDKKKEELIPFKGTLKTVESIHNCLKIFFELALLDESLGYYVFLKKDENIENTKSNELYQKYVYVAMQLSEISSFIIPEILENDKVFLEKLVNDPVLSEYKIFLNKEVRYKSHILSSAEEKLLAGLGEIMDTASQGFSILTNVDMNFGEIKKDGVDLPLTQSSLISFMEDENREIRKQAREQFFQEFDKHKNTLASFYSNSIKKDIFTTKTRNFASTRAKALFSDNVDVKVYDNLIKGVHKSLPQLHRYYALRQKKLNLSSLHLHDMNVALVKETKINIPYEQGVDIVCEALKPLGKEYCDILRNGLLNGWVDRYENKGKRSGAYSAGSYKGFPYILLNYREDSLNSLFTLAHEAGHSMHSWYSVKNNGFVDYNYTIFEAEVASTLNEQLLSDYLIKNDVLDISNEYLYNSQIKDIIGTIFRQTMFAEFEMLAYEKAEQGIPLTLDLFRKIYRELLEKYFGDNVKLADFDDLEGLRIPHFYRSFYVYKYATGLSAAISLSDDILNNKKDSLDKYLNFLKSGGTQFPIDSLRKAGVDLSCGKPLDKAIEKFENLLDKLEKNI